MVLEPAPVEVLVCMLFFSPCLDCGMHWQNNGEKSVLCLIVGSVADATSSARVDCNGLQVERWK